MSKKIYDSLTELVGNTPLVRLHGYEKKLGLKAKLLAKGVTGYLQFYPVIRKTTRSKDKPAVVCANLMKVGAPAGCPLTVSGAWQWLATADNCSQQSDRTWRRVQMWTGAEVWDELLYDRAPSGGGAAS